MISCMEFVSVKQFGAKGDGIADDTAAIQAALDSGALRVEIPTGLYRVTATLKVHSNTEIAAADTARVYLCGSTQKHRGDYLLTNADHENGNVEITVNGGVWDGNHSGKGNEKPDIYDENGYSGVALNFFNVKGLHLHGLVIANSVTYNLRMCRIEDFTIENIGFLSDELGWNQDGLHFGGDCRHGVVKNIRALSKGQTNDDMIALNADDYVLRVENRGKVCGDIEDISFENIYAEDCHTIIRFLTDTSAIRNIRFKNIFGGYRCNAINADCGRYMRTPLFEENERPNGVGRIENVTIENMMVYPTQGVTEQKLPEGMTEADLPPRFKAGRHPGLRSAIVLESHADGLLIDNFCMTNRMELPNPGGALWVRNLQNTMVVTDGELNAVHTKEDTLHKEKFTSLRVNKM